MNVALANEESKLSVKAPPPELFTFIIRHLLYPSITPHDIPDILELLSSIEHYRRYVSGRARAALIHTRFAELNNLPETGLTEDDKKVLKEVQDNSTLRGDYLEMASQYCLLVSEYP